MATVSVIAGSAGAFQSEPTVSTVLPASAGPVRPNSPVQFHGVRVGVLSGVEAGTTGSRLTLRIDPEWMPDIPRNVQVRLMPRTLFGDQYLDLVAHADATPGRSLAAGAMLPADTSAPTVELYQSYTRMYQVLDTLEPAKLQVALTALADALHGRGDDIGSMIDHASQLAGESQAMVDGLGRDLHTMSELTASLRASGPDLLHTLENAVALSHAVVDEKEQIGALLTAGIELTGRSRRLVTENSRRAITLVRSVDPIADVLGRHPTAISDAGEGLNTFLDGGNRAFATGFFKIRASVTLDNPHPYSPADCPRYPGLSGPNCGAGGPIGPVGSPEELDTMRELAPLLPTPPGPETPPSPDVMGLLLGPVVRGAQVVTP